mmetsp:Transcript_52343/g.114493  ORF Transcript_52343/g.114493 Transcript_52343/m.114493 type:complete len:401 (-) Transcript_52343:57-1259(-)
MLGDAHWSKPNARSTDQDAGLHDVVIRKGWHRLPETDSRCTENCLKLFFKPRKRHSSAVNLLHVDGEVDEAVGVAPLVVVPAHKLHEGVVERDAGTHIEDGGGLAGREVRGDNLLIGPVQDTRHGARRGLLDGGHDLLVLGTLLQAHREVHDGDIRGRHAEGHAGELAVHGRDHLAHGLRGARGGRNDVLRGAAATAPVLAATGGAIHGELRGRHGVHRGHEALDDAELLVHDLRERREAVRGAGGVGDHGVGGLVVKVVHANDVDGHGVLGRGGDDDLLGTTLDVQLGLPLLGEDARGLADVVRARGTPRDRRRVLLVEDLDVLAVHHEELLAVRLLGLHGARKPAVHRVVPELVDHVLQVHEGVVHGLKGDLRVAHRRAEHEAANAAEAVDAHGRHDC